MDLKFFAGQMLLKTEIGRNLSFLPAKLNKLSKVTESITIGNLLSFEESEVQNFFKYDADSEIFKFEHKDSGYIAKANAKLDKSRVDFSAEFREELTTEYGISYIGSIHIIYTDEIFLIKVPGELSYDPASTGDDTLWVDSTQVNKIVVLVCILVKSSLLGANSKFLRRIYTVMKPIISKYYKKKELFKWMYTQVKFACMKKKPPPTYAEFLSTLNFEEHGIKQYLNTVSLLKEGQIEEILPPQEFFNAVADIPEFNTRHNIENSIDQKDGGYFLCASPDIDEDSVPSVQEMLEDLKKVRERYEKDMLSCMGNVQKLGNTKILRLVDQFQVVKKFDVQCPII